MNRAKDTAEPTLTDVIEIMRDGFDRVEARFDAIDERLDTHDNRFDLLEARMDQHFTEVEDRLLSLEKGQTKIFRELDEISHKQDGTLLSLDDTVARGEFDTLVIRVDTLELARA